ncbi:MAG: apolipoprotein N-acyltransferase [Rickettsiaceae bacterium]|nr:apolipoprotein N-acyltransferase [Rickettsiaceae bacterium]
MYSIKSKISQASYLTIFSSKKSSFLAGILCGLAFAPVFFIPGILTLSILCWQIRQATNLRQAFFYSYIFGFGFFLATIYWIAIAPTLYQEFWWTIPIILIGFPLFMALFISLVGIFSFPLKNHSYYHIIFCCFWVFYEWILSWAFTGFPWSCLGYVIAFSDILSQIVSVFSVFGASFLLVYIGSSLYKISDKKHYMFKVNIITSCVIIILLFVYGSARLMNNKTGFTNIKIRIVQPSTQQQSKWDPMFFWQNLYKLIDLSTADNDDIDIILWSEAALTVPYYHNPILKALMTVFTKEHQVLMSGGVNDNNLEGDEYEIYSSLIALDDNGDLLIDYHKSHLVPFGEYIPLKDILPLNKFTPGAIDYVQGHREIVTLEKFKLKIKPLICYESIFPFEVLTSNRIADVIFNVTNDAWYGISSGPYQHFYINKIRAIENGLPMVRSGNNGISAIIDPVGRIIQKLELNEVSFIDGFIPKKLAQETLFTKIRYITFLLILSIVLILQLLIIFIVKKSY